MINGEVVKQLRQSVPGKLFSADRIDFELTRNSGEVVPELSIVDLSLRVNEHPKLGTTLSIRGKDISFVDELFRAYVYLENSGLVAVTDKLTKVHHLYTYKGTTTDTREDNQYR